MALTVQNGGLVVRDGKLGTGQGCCCGGSAPTECVVGIRIKAPLYYVEVLGDTTTRKLFSVFNCNMRPDINFSGTVIALPRQGFVQLYYNSNEWRCRVGVIYLGCPFSWSTSSAAYTSGPLSVAADGLPSAQSLELSDFTISEDYRAAGCPCFEVRQIASYNVCENNFPSLLEIIREV